jgi:hypothetical protein
VDSYLHRRAASAQVSTKTTAGISTDGFLRGSVERVMAYQPSSLSANRSGRPRQELKHDDCETERLRPCQVAISFASRNGNEPQVPPISQTIWL